MGLFDFFTRRKARIRRKRKSKGSNNTIKNRLKTLEARIDIIDAVLQKHQQQNDEEAQILQEHCGKIKTLEKLIARPPINQTIVTTKPTTPPDQPAKADQTAAKFDIDAFSPQEKRILGMFFEHRDMALSYRDIASSLNKAPTTIKNQIHQILLKADILEKHIYTGMTNRFKLKDAIRIEKYLTSQKD